MSMSRRFTETFEIWAHSREIDEIGGTTLESNKIGTLKAVIFPEETAVSSDLDLDTRRRVTGGAISSASFIIVTRDYLPANWMERQVELRRGITRFRVRQYTDFRRVRQIALEVI